MKTNPHLFPPDRPQSRRAFTMTELLVVIAVIAFLFTLRVSTLASAKDQTLRGQCANRLRTLALSTAIFANENGDRFPSNSPAIGLWPWDMTWNAGNMLTQYVSIQTFYCPASGFTPEDNTQLWNYGAGSFHVIGYAPTFSATPSLNPTNLNSTLTPQRVQVSPSLPTAFMPAPSAAQRVLFADPVISAIGENNPAAASTYNWTVINGGYSKPHRTCHMDGALPAGGNLAMLDGHVEWRSFPLMVPRVQSGTTSPVFWW